MGFYVASFGFPAIDYMHLRNVIQGCWSVSSQSANSLFLIFGSPSFEEERILSDIRRLFSGISGYFVRSVHFDRVSRVVPVRCSTQP